MSLTYKTIFVPATMQEARKGFKHYDSDVDGDQLSNDIQATLILMQGEGFRLHSMSPVVSTQYYAKTYTDGMLLVFEKPETDPS